MSYSRLRFSNQFLGAESRQIQGTAFKQFLGTENHQSLRKARKVSPEPGPNPPEPKTTNENEHPAQNSKNIRNNGFEPTAWHRTPTTEGKAKKLSPEPGPEATEPPESRTPQNSLNLGIFLALEQQFWSFGTSLPPEPVCGEATGFLIEAPHGLNHFCAPGGVGSVPAKRQSLKNP